MINTVEGFIDAIGGTTNAAAAFGVTAPAVSNWKADNRFPAWALMRVMEIAQKNGLTLSTKLFAVIQPIPNRSSRAKKPKRKHIAAAE